MALRAAALALLSVLLLALAPRADDAPKAASFLPSSHGFRFVNSFTGTPLPPSLRNLGIERQMQIPDHYGLCGGMSLAAADFFLAGEAIPDAAKPPTEGTPLYEYIYRRQNDSMGPLAIMAAKFAQWMQLPDTSPTGDSTASLTAKELPGILTRLGRGELVPLGLVYSRTGDKGNDKLWENHQVLAYKATTPKNQASGSHDLFIYDPNFPKDDRVVIRIRTLANEAAITCTLVSGSGRSRPVRGLFPMPYTKAKPIAVRGE